MTCVSHSRARKTPYTLSKMYSANGHAIHICQVAQATLETMLLYEGTVSVSYGLARMEQHTTCVCSITDNSEWLIIAGMVGGIPKNRGRAANGACHAPGYAQGPGAA